MGAKLKLAFKRAVSSMLYYSGAIRILKLIILRRRAVALMYHRVLTREENGRTFSHAGIVVEKEVFEMHMRFLKKEFRVVGEKEFLSRLRDRKPFETATCLVTFDDGWLDNAANAFPTLKEHGIPALVFLSAGHIGSKEPFWQERMKAMLEAISKENTAGGVQLLESYGLSAGLSAKELSASISDFVYSRKSCEPGSIAGIMREISGHAGIRPPQKTDRFLDWDQVKSMMSSGIVFGAHGVSHNLLTIIPAAEADSEIVESRRMIEKKTGRAPDSFSYPNGDFDDGTATLVKKHGYAAAFTTKRGFVRHTDDPFRLKRVNIHNDATMTVPMFYCRILGVF
ncbi:MAG: polysaccharide deacetylase family protein [Thermodesulfobacteriota bacterium]|nr:MAG: polysaccharide deacetylase family protein [Thermodesulfobacteriota bacterium]